MGSHTHKQKQVPRRILVMLLSIQCCMGETQPIIVSMIYPRVNDMTSSERCWRFRWRLGHCCMPGNVGASNGPCLLLASISRDHQLVWNSAPGPSLCHTSARLSMSEWLWVLWMGLRQGWRWSVQVLDKAHRNVGMGLLPYLQVN